MKSILIPAVALGALLSFAGLGSTSASATNGTTGVLIAAGKLLNTAGSAVAGANLTLYMWPSDSVLDSQVDGDAVNLIPVGSGATESDGTFSVRLSDVDLLDQGLSTSDDTADFSLVASVGDETLAHFAFSRRVLTTTILGITKKLIIDPRSVRDLLTDNPLATVLGLLVETLDDLTLTLDGAGSEPAADGELSDDPGEIESVDPEGTDIVEKNCVSTKTASYDPKLDLVGVHGSTTSNVKADFKYSSGADSTLGVGYSVSGSSGSWRQSGTQSKSSSGTIDYDAKTGKGYFGRKTYFKWAKYKVVCSDPYSHSSWYELRSTGWAGGASTVKYSSTPTATKCVPQASGTTFTKSSTNATTWASGASVKGIIGIDLSSRTGYRTDSSVSFKFTAASRMCGTADYPGQTPGTLIARPQ